MFFLLLLLTILLTCIRPPAALAEPVTLTITALSERNLVQLSWPPQPGVRAWHIYRATHPLFAPAAVNFRGTVTDTLLYDSLTVVRAFYRVLPARDDFSISVQQRDLILDQGDINSEYFSTVQITGDTSGIALLTTLPHAERQQEPLPWPTTICWRENGLVAFDRSDSLLLNVAVTMPTADPWNGLDNGRLGPLGGYSGFAYRSFAIANGWNFIADDSLLILQKDTLHGGEMAILKLVVDNNCNLLLQSEVHRQQRGLVTRYHYCQSTDPILLERREQFSLRADTLHRVVITEYFDYNLEEEEISLNPSAWPITTPVSPPPCPAPVPPATYNNWSPCSILGAMEDMSTNPRLERMDCTQCHDQVPPRAFLLLHGLNSSPVTFNLMQDWLESRYDCFFYRPYFSSSFTPQQMRDSLAARLDRLGNFQWMGIGHSLGGLVGRDLLQSSNGNVLMQGLITIGSPHNGTAMSANTPVARALFNDLRDDIEDLVSLNIIDWALGTDLSATFQSMGDYFNQIEDCAAVDHLPPQSNYIDHLQEEDSSLPYQALGCRSDYFHPLAELYAGLTVNYSPPYPFGELDQQRQQLCNEFINTWNYLESLTWTFRFIDAVNDIHWDLVTMNNDWTRYVLEAEQEYEYSLYSYHEDNDCFFCPRPPFCGREWCCHENPQDPDGARFWCCFNCGSDEIVCYLGEASTTLELPNDAVISLREQTWHSGVDSALVIVNDVSHLGETTSDRVYEKIEQTLYDWNWGED